MKILNNVKLSIVLHKKDRDSALNQYKLSDLPRHSLPL